jgi:hypothetical protein
VAEISALGEETVYTRASGVSPLALTRAVVDSQHLRIPPAAHDSQGAVETIHLLEDNEFFDLEDFSDRSDFLAKVNQNR